LLFPIHTLFGQRMNAPDMRSVNGIQLLNLIHSRGPVSRAELSKLSGLSKPTVSEQVGRLIRLGAVIEIGQGEASESGGKRPTLVSFHAAAGKVAGVDIGADHLRVAIADLEGRILRQTKVPTRSEKSPARIREQIERALLSLDGADRGLRAIGIGVPGRVDCRSGIVLELGNVFEWHDVDLRTPLEERFGCPVCVDNDVNVALTAEIHSGAGREAETTVLIQAGTGIGSAIAIGRRIHHGAHWAAGEIGHLTTEPPSRKQVSPRGQMELVLGEDQIGKRVQAAARRSPTLRRYTRTLSPISALFAAAAERDPIAVALAAPIENYAAFAVANLALAYDPDTVLLSGEIFRYVLPAIEKLLSRTVPWSPKVQQARFGEEGVLMGAIHTALPAAYEQLAAQLAADAGPATALAAGQ
jgi:predicted NBD/HSP70 family sugar kinase